MQNPNDMPTVARMRSRLREIGRADITMKEAVYVFGVTTATPIRLRLERGELSGAIVMGQWLISAESINAYLDKVNSQFNRGL